MIIGFFYDDWYDKIINNNFIFRYYQGNYLGTINYI